MQAQLACLEVEKKSLDIAAVQKQQELEAATAETRKLSDQIEAVTKALEEKCRLAISQADQKTSQLQVGTWSMTSLAAPCSTSQHRPHVLHYHTSSSM